jgi:hypothetical protein
MGTNKNFCWILCVAYDFVLVVILLLLVLIVCLDNKVELQIQNWNKENKSDKYVTKFLHLWNSFCFKQNSEEWYLKTLIWILTTYLS